MKAQTIDGGTVHSVRGPHRAPIGWVTECTGRPVRGLELTHADVTCEACIATLRELARLRRIREALADQAHAAAEAQREEGR